MFPNLKAEMARYDITRAQIINALNITQKSYSNKMSGRTEFTLSEIKRIKKMFPGLSLEYLFDTGRAEMQNNKTD